MPDTTAKRFTDYDLKPEVLAGLEKMGYTHPTPVQEAAIPAVATGKDLMVQARTGTGKTLGFGLPVLNHIDATSPDTQVLVILPTRELAVQVADELARAGEMLQIIVAAVFGGVKVLDQVDEMQWAPIVVGTPGRLRDHIERGFLHLDTCKVVVLDEADEMLDMGFKDDLEFILKKVPAEHRQTLLFSATFPPEIEKIAKKYMRDPEKIEVSSGMTPAVGLTHKFARVPKDKKIQALATLLRQDDVTSGIIFCDTKVETAWVYQRLKRDGFSIGIITGDIPQEKRLLTLQAFRDGELNLLVATDVAARGLDIPAVSHVYHFTVPRDTATYVHRSGRTARAGKRGTAFTLVTPEEDRDFQRIMAQIKQNAPAGAAAPAAPAPAPGAPVREGRPERGGREARGEREGREVRGEREGREGRGEREGREGRGEREGREGRGEREGREGGRFRDRDRMPPLQRSEAYAPSREARPAGSPRLEPIPGERAPRGERGGREQGRFDRQERGPRLEREGREVRPEREARPEREGREGRGERGGRERFERRERGQAPEGLARALATLALGDTGSLVTLAEGLLHQRDAARAIAALLSRSPEALELAAALGAATTAPVAPVTPVAPVAAVAPSAPSQPHVAPEAEAAPRRTRRSRTASAPAAVAPVAEAPAPLEAPVEAAPAAEPAAPKRRTSRTTKAAASAPEAVAPVAEAPVEEAPKPRATRTRAKKVAEPAAEAPASVPAAAPEEAAEAPKRRRASTRAKKETTKS